MKKLLFLAILALLFSPIIAQTNKDEINYNAKTISIVITDKNGNETSRKTIGKNVFVTNDIVFKSYTMYYTNEDGETERFALSYLDDYKVDAEFEKYGVKSYEMTDKQHEKYYVTDMLKQIGKLKILIPKSTAAHGFPVWMIVEGAKQIDLK